MRIKIDEDRRRPKSEVIEHKQKVQSRINEDRIQIRYGKRRGEISEEFSHLIEKHFADHNLDENHLLLLPLQSLVLLKGLEIIPTELLRKFIPEIKSSTKISKLLPDQRRELRFFLQIFSVAVLYLIEVIVNIKSEDFSDEERDEKKEAMLRDALKKELMVADENIPLLPNITLIYGRLANRSTTSMPAIRILTGVFSDQVKTNVNLLTDPQFGNFSTVPLEFEKLVASAFAQIPYFNMGTAKELRSGIITAIGSEHSQ